MYWAHHLGCWVIILQFFFTTAPGIFIFGGGVAMEFGGAAQTVHLLYPDDATLDLMHVATMTLSHVPCGVREPSSRRRADAVLGATSRRWRGVSTQVVCCTSAIYYATIPPTPLWARLIIMLLVFKLAQARQSNAMYLHGLYLERRAKRTK